MITLQELLDRHGRLTRVHVERWVARGLLRPTREAEVWHFEQIDVARTGLLADLTADIGLDDEAAEIVVALLDQVHALRRQLGLLGAAIAEQPTATREAIAATLTRLGDR